MGESVGDEREKREEDLQNLQATKEAEHGYLHETIAALRAKLEEYHDNRT
ncbi:hypothetical protein ES703_51834 [subsurface metagenome]